MGYISNLRKKIGHDPIFMPAAACILIKDNKSKNWINPESRFNGIFTDFRPSQNRHITPGRTVIVLPGSYQRSELITHYLTNVTDE